jgi:hypothetical protein
MRKLCHAAAAIAVSVAMSRSTAQATLYGVTFENHQLININQTIGAGTLRRHYK